MMWLGHTDISDLDLFWRAKCENFFQKSISMRDVSAFGDNFAKLNVRNLQKVPNQRRRNFGSDLYGFVMFVKIIIIVMSL